jgi:2-C-methyl-D-erythritol 4-phosphate cytidylyltransferase
MSVVGILAAAGRGERFGAHIPKQFLPLRGIPLVIRAARCLQEAEAVAQIVAAVPPGYQELLQRWAEEYGVQKLSRIVVGGEHRQDSVRAALETPEVQRAELVLVHDAARPFATAALVERVLQAAQRHGAAVPGIPPAETIKKVAPTGEVVQTLAREWLRRIQTPQAFRREWLVAAHAHARRLGLSATDDAALVELLGFPVVVVEGEPLNLKLTTPEDWRVAEALLQAEQ